MSARRALGYYLREALWDLWKRGTINIVSIAAIGATLYILGIFVVLMTNAAKAVASWAEDSRVSIYLADDCVPADRVALEEQISRSPAVSAWEYVTKDEALVRFRRDFPDLADLAGEGASNPLPASFEVALGPAGSDPSVLESFARSFEGLPGVDGVRYDLLWLERVRSLLKVLAWAGGVLGAVLVLASVITISGVIRLNVLARRDEIAILELVGATRGFIRGPFLLEGAFQGGAAALLAVGLIAGTWAVVSSSPRVREDALLAAIAGPSVPLWAPAFLLAVGLAVGMAGSLLSVRRAFAPHRS